jgi:PKD repeat protein
MAYAIYNFDTSGKTTDGNLRLLWASKGTASELWIALADFDHDRWMWYTVPETDFLAYSKALHESNNRLLAVILCAGAVEWELSNLRIVSETPPAVTGVSPLTGNAGQSRTFSLTASGGPATSWLWNFGAAAQPSTSTSASPTVQLAGAGTYSCSVAITNNCGTDTYNFLLTIRPASVHIFFTPAANNGSGTKAVPFGLNSGAQYTFTAKDNTGVDITGEVTFELQDEDGGSENDPAWFDGNVLHTGPFGFGTIRAVGYYHKGQGDEMGSDPDLAGQGRYFVVQ